jgi:peptidoglycan L-alanyl-D-glutamate endopeptidase CwlK
VEKEHALMDTASEIRLQSVCPSLLEKVQLADAEFQAQTCGDHLEVVQGLRSWFDQEQLWLKGRDPQGNIVNSALVVTNAPAGHSWHEYGLAADVVPRSLLPVKGWCPDSILWGMITKIAEKVGLVSGSCWQHKDLPHLQLTGKYPVSPTDEVRKLYAMGGVFKVWDAAGLS